MNDLKQHIVNTPLVDTHEHLHPEKIYTQNKQDILQVLFANPYIGNELVIAGADPEAVQRVINPEAYEAYDIEKRFAGIQNAWEQCRHTGYGDAVRHIGKVFFDISEISSSSIIGAHSKIENNTGERFHLLKEMANIDHVHIDYFNWKIEIDKENPTFFLYDMSWFNFAIGNIDFHAIYEETGIDVKDIKTLGYAMEKIYEEYAPMAIAVKTQHAYARTLKWAERTDPQADAVVHKLTAGKKIVDDDNLCLGDWALARGIELATKNGLPIKIHTGMGAGSGHAEMAHMIPRHLCPLINKFPEARFVLFHIGYPYYEEVISMAKQYPNVYIDMCWAWSFNPYSASDCLRKMIHAIPANKIFAFGGDHAWPYMVVAFANQAREWIFRTLQAEVDEGFMSEKEAMTYAQKIMHDNQYKLFDVQGTREALLSRFRKIEMERKPSS